MCVIIISHSILHQFKTLAPVLSSGAPVVLSCTGSVLCALAACQNTILTTLSAPSWGRNRAQPVLHCSQSFWLVNYMLNVSQVTFM